MLNEVKHPSAAQFSRAASNFSANHRLRPRVIHNLPQSAIVGALEDGQTRC